MPTTLFAFMACGLLLQSALIAVLLVKRRRAAQPVARDRRLAPSRDAFDRLGDREVERARTLGHDLNLAIFDVDHLAQVNEQQGYAAGDAAIGLLEGALVTTVRRIDTVLRLGGGSWAVLLPDVDGDELRDRVEGLRNRLQGRIATQVADVDDPSASLITLSVGIATSRAGETELADLFQSADQATLAAKLQGGNRTASWGDAAQDVIRRATGRRRVQRDAQLATVLSLAEALDLRDADTSNHSRMVGHYAELMAQGLGMSPARVERVRVAGLLHDIGKIGVPDSVLRKPAKLDDDEWAQMQAHPEIGARLLASVDAEDIRSWVLAHHERPDGRGYPYGLTDAEIPIEAKILSVADAYEAMTADRVYRSAPGPVIARSELDKWRGAQFDSDVVDVFLQVLDEIAPLPVELEQDGEDDVLEAAA
ncbi:MAG: diguanylate cyclase and metal dependent phosphohydrolase [Thermoleophilia bacterium]|nr:diguanylate cyclase and metal dependent phosphohydrolase [Thermoleophilia bacterium]